MNDHERKAAVASASSTNETMQQQLVAEIHKAIRSGSYRQLVEDCLLPSSSSSSEPSSNAWKDQQNLLWQTNQLGWHAIHVAASCHVIPIEWWEYLLQVACGSCDGQPQKHHGAQGAAAAAALRQQEEEAVKERQQVANNNNNLDSRDVGYKLVSCRTSLGYSAIDLFFRTWLDPFPWQRRHLSASQSLVQTMREIIIVQQQHDQHGDTGLLHRFVQCLQQVRNCQKQLQQQQLQRRFHSKRRNGSAGSSNNDHTTLSYSTPIPPPLPTTAATTTSPFLFMNDDDDDDPIQQVAQFWYRLEILFQCARDQILSQGHDDNRITTQMAAAKSSLLTVSPSTSSSSSSSYSLLCCLAHTGCPKVVAQLAIRLALHDQNTSTSSSSCYDGVLPLFIWAQSQEHGPDYRWKPTKCTKVGRKSEESNNNINLSDSIIDTNNDNGNGTLQALLEAWPQAAATTARAASDHDSSLQQQLPLHTALANGKSWQQVLPLFLAYPDALWTTDRSTNLPCFCLAAAATELNSRPLDHQSCDPNSKKAKQQQQVISLCARQQLLAVKSTAGSSGESSLWHFLPQSKRQQAMEMAMQQVDADHVTTIYQVLRAFPNAVLVAVTNNKEYDTGR